MHLANESPKSSSGDTILLLPTHTTAAMLAEDCRDVALAFLDESENWGKAQLAMWLIGPYSRVTQMGQRLTKRAGDAPRPMPPLLRDIDAYRVDRLIASARERVIGVLMQMVDPQFSANFAFEMMNAGFVVRCEDQYGVAGWVPTNEARHLADRVLALIAVDYLMHPTDYDRQLSVCAPASGEIDEMDDEGDVDGFGAQSGRKSGTFRSMTPSMLESTWAPSANAEQSSMPFIPRPATLPYFASGA